MRRFTSSVSPKGQITIPAEIRRQLGIKPKDRVTIELAGNEVRVAPAEFTLESARGSRPALSRPMSVEEMVRIAREEHVARVIAEMEEE